MKEVFYVQKAHHYGQLHTSIEIYPEMYLDKVEARETIGKLIEQFKKSGLYEKEF